MRSKKAIFNIISSFGLQIITIICGFIIPKLIIKTYGSQVNGLVASITQFLAFITLLEAGFGPVIKAILYKPIAKKDKSTIERILKSTEKIFKTISLVFVAYIIILCVLLPVVLENEFSKMFTVSLIAIISISIFAEYYFGMTYRLYLQAEQRKYVVSVIQMVTLVINTITVLVLIKFGANIQIVKLASSLIFILRPVFQNVYVKKKYNINLKKVEDSYKIKQKWDGLAQHIAYVVHSNTDVAILTLCGNLSEVSVYAVYSMIVESVKNVVRSLADGIDAAFGDMIAKDEKDNLNRNFKAYESAYFTISTIIFSATFFLILPFVSLYVKDITDANYIRPFFAYLLVLAKFIYIIRQPYNDLVKVAGHFKQTRVGAWVEAISNIVISFVLVWKFGIVGVAIGTIISMFIRTIEFMFYASKNILKRSVWDSLKNIVVISIEFIVIIIIANWIPKFEVYNYGSWIIMAICIVAISSIVVLLINGYVYRNSFKYILKKLRKVRK